MVVGVLRGLVVESWSLKEVLRGWKFWHVVAQEPQEVRGGVYEYWTLCETVRTEKGPRQRVVATLGKLSEEDIAAGWEDIEALLEGRRPATRQMNLDKAQTDRTQTRWEWPDLSKISVERVREFGSVYLALALWRRLGLHELLEELLEPGRETVDWAQVAAVLTVGKFCGQASELSIAESWYARTALEDLSGIDPVLVNDDRLYRGLDKLGEHKDRLCEHLMARCRDWFGVRFEFLLYDVSPTASGVFVAADDAGFEDFHGTIN